MQRLKNLTRHLINGLLILTLLSLTGCSNLMSSKMPEGSVTMTQAYNNAINGTDGTNDSGPLNYARDKVRSLKEQTSNYTAYTRTQENEIDNQFPRLPNPNIIMYVFPHEAGTSNHIAPVPGYSTVFPLYTHVQYAMPGEVDTFN